MARALALTQLLIVGLGVFVLHLLVKIETGAPRPEEVAGLAVFLARYGLWLFAVPIFYIAVTTAIENKSNKKALEMAGGVITVVLLLLLGFPICFHLF